MSLIGRGAVGTVYRLNSFIAVKRARTGEDEQTDHANEQKIFHLIEKSTPVPYLIRCYYQRPNDTFLEFAHNGSIAMLLGKHQERSKCGTRVLGVTQNVDLYYVHRWMKQLCIAAADLERIGLAHGDIRPSNMLLDADYNLRLSDFDRGMRVGDEIAVVTEPFGRLLGEQDSEGAGTYGKAGARTETFAIGSVYFTLLRGYEPYETEAWESSRHFVILSEMFQKKEFPPLTNSAADAVIWKCWNGKYRHVRELLTEFEGGIEQDGTLGVDQAWSEIRQMECKQFIDSGQVDLLERY